MHAITDPFSIPAGTQRNSLAKLIASALLAGWLVASVAHAQQLSDPDDQPPVEALGSPVDVDPMLTYLQARLANRPDHADTWRLIGNRQRQRGDHRAALDALKRALELGPDEAAIQFDMGQLMETVGDSKAAAEHFRLVVALAPESDYASALYRSGKASKPAAASNDPIAEEGMIEQVRYEIQTFDGSDDLGERILELESEAQLKPRSLRASLELGALYNSNVTLTPISRELADSDAASFQAFASPDVEWIVSRGTFWRSGAIARGYFTINEARFSSFDLASLQPGAFLERDLTYGSNELMAKLEYLYSLDLLGGDRFGDRHGLTASLIVIRSDLDVLYGYLSTSYSQFDNDGDNPAVTSLDGPAITAGISRFLQTESSWLPTYSIGVDLSSADTRGADFRYHAVNGFIDTTIVFGPCWSLLPSAGVGFRDYSDFTGLVSRDEVTWRVGAKLVWAADDRRSVFALVGHDRFASQNDEFDAERTQAGVATAFIY